MLRWRTITGSLTRLTIWVLLLATWEAAYRVVDWKPWVFPAPSHVLDASLGMLNIQTRFGAPLDPRWPWPKHTASASERAGAAAYKAGQPLDKNPHPRNTVAAIEWERGYKDASHTWLVSGLVTS